MPHVLRAPCMDWPDAPWELVFEALTEVRHLSRWWGPEGFTTTTRSFEFRVGGGQERPPTDGRSSVVYGSEGESFEPRQRFTGSLDGWACIGTRGALKLSRSRCRTAISRSVPRRLRLFNLGVGSPTRACHEVNPDPWKLPQLLGDTGDHEQRFSSIGIQID